MLHGTRSRASADKPWRAILRPGAVLLGGVLSLNAGPALSQQAETVSVELNRLEQAHEACQAYLVLGNETQSDFESLSLDVVMFDEEGIVSRRMAVELAPLPADKTSVRVFSLDGTACEAVGRVLLNSVLNCRDQTGERSDCLADIETSSRASVPFIE